MKFQGWKIQRPFNPRWTKASDKLKAIAPKPKKESLMARAWTSTKLFFSFT
jgi:hypothetical protein